MGQALIVSRAAQTAAEEHRRLRALVALVEGAFGRPQPRALTGPDAVAAGLDTLRGPLTAHFEEEERAHLYEGIEELAPEQAPVCARLKGEHEALIRRLDTLRTASPEARRGPTWSHDVRALLDDLAVHEDRESDLLTRTLDGSIAAAD
jgi:hypothetical protein